LVIGLGEGDTWVRAVSGEGLVDGSTGGQRDGLDDVGSCGVVNDQDVADRRGRQQTPILQEFDGQTGPHGPERLGGCSTMAATTHAEFLLRSRGGGSPAALAGVDTRARRLVSGFNETARDRWRCG